MIAVTDAGQATHFHMVSIKYNRLFFACCQKNFFKTLQINVLPLCQKNSNVTYINFVPIYRDFDFFSKLIPLECSHACSCVWMCVSLLIDIIFATLDARMTITNTTKISEATHTYTQ